MPLTTKREVRERIRKFVIDASVEYCIDSGDCESSSTECALLKVYESFKKEVPRIIIRYGEYNGFIQWLRGVNMPIPYTYYEERKVVAEWLDETIEESEKYNNDQVDQLYYHLFTREFFALCKKYKIEDKYNMKTSELTDVESSNVNSIYNPSDIKTEFENYKFHNLD